MNDTTRANIVTPSHEVFDERIRAAKAEAGHSTIRTDTFDTCIADVIYRFFEDVETQTIDFAHLTGENDPEITIGTTAAVIGRGTAADPARVQVTFWNEDAPDGAVELGIFEFNVERVI